MMGGHVVVNCVVCQKNELLPVCEKGRRRKSWFCMSKIGQSACSEGKSPISHALVIIEVAR